MVDDLKMNVTSRISIAKLILYLHMPQENHLTPHFC